MTSHGPDTTTVQLVASLLRRIEVLERGRTMLPVLDADPPSLVDGQTWVHSTLGLSVQAGGITHRTALVGEPPAPGPDERYGGYQAGYAGGGY